MKTFSLPESQFHRILRETGDVAATLDENVVILCDSSDAENYENRNVEWMLVSTKSQPYKCVFRPVITSCDINRISTLILTNTNLFNINSGASSGLKPSICNDVLIQSSKKFIPRFATTMEIAMMNTYHGIDVSIIDDCLKNYFLKSRYLEEGNLIRIVISQYIPDVYRVSIKNNVDELYFKVQSLKGSPYTNLEDGIDHGYYVNMKYVTLHQVHSIQSFIPSQHTEISNFVYCDIEKEIYPVIPCGMDEIYEKLEELILPFILLPKGEIKLCPVFLLSGRSGTGKSTLLLALSKKHGIRYWSENCTLIQNSNPAQSESIINNIFSKIADLSPCILHFRNIEALCEDESNNRDDRTIDCFIKNIKSLKSNLPIIIFCTTSQDSKIIPNLQRIFLQTVKIGLLNIDQRFSLLSWILKKENIQVENLDKIVSNTSNFVFSDFIQLISRTLKTVYQTSTLGTEKVEDVGKHVCFDNFNEALNKMNETYANAIGAADVPNVSWDDIGGLSHLKEELLSSLWKPILPNGLRRSGLLLYGPPGTGKTLLAKAVATECKYNFLSVKGPELLNMYVGQSEKNIREVFSRASESAPCVVFFDEFDSLAPKRGQSGGSGSVMDRVVSQLSAEMDGIQKSNGIFILAATNRPDLIDPALLRPGRLDKMLYVGKSKDAQSRLAILKALTRKFKFAGEINLEEMISYLSDYNELTGADFYGICSNAWLCAARRHIKRMQINDDINLENEVLVSSDDMLNAISQFKIEDSSSD